MNRDYQKFGKASFDRALRHLSMGDDLKPEALRSLWEVYENFLNSMELRNPAQDARNTIRDRNKLFASLLAEQGLVDLFLNPLFQLKEAHELAQLQPRIYHEETFQRRRVKDTSAHDAFSSDFERYLSGANCKAPIARLLDLLYVVRCNLDHGQKVLSNEWAVMKQRNELIFNLTVPLQKKLAQLLFENLWADGVFVYGTCKPDEGNFVHISPLVDEYSDGWQIEGFLYDLGAYPGFISQPGSHTGGYILRTKILGTLLRRLDELEGSKFTRKLLFARSQDTKAEPALVWVYCFTGETESVPRYRRENWHSENRNPTEHD